MEASMDAVRPDPVLQLPLNPERRNGSSLSTSPAAGAAAKASPLRWPGNRVPQRGNGCGVERMPLERGQFVFDQFFDSFQHHNLTGIAKRERDACRSRSRGTADSVDVAFCVIRQFVVDDMRNTFDVDSTRHDVRSDEYRHPAFIERSKAALAVVLTFVGMDSVRRNPVAGQVPHNALGTMFGSGKH